MPTCENCGAPMSLFRARQRFCCRACSDRWFAEERRQAVEWFRAMGLRPQTRPTERQERKSA
jgi:DNA-directed RNA polymerase subunit RPC12/RpoP